MCDINRPSMSQSIADCSSTEQCSLLLTPSIAAVGRDDHGPPPAATMLAAAVSTRHSEGAQT